MICPTSNAHGETVIVRAVNVPGRDVRGWDYMGVEVDIPTIQWSGGDFCVFENHELRPIPDEYDGHEISSWNECPFKPMELVS